MVVKTHNGKQEEKYLIFFIILYLIVDTLYTDTKKKYVKSCSRQKEIRFKHTHTQSLMKRDGIRKGYTCNLRFTNVQREYLRRRMNPYIKRSVQFCT